MLGTEFSRLAQQDMALFSVNQRRYRWSEIFAAGLGIMPFAQQGHDRSHDVTVLMPLLFAALQIRAYGQTKSTPKSDLSSLPLNRLFALAERIREHPKQFLTASVEEAWSNINELCFDIWGRTAIEEMVVDYELEEDFFQQLLRNGVVSETVTTCFADYHLLRGKLLKLLIQTPGVVLDPALFASELLPKLRPLAIWCRADGIDGRPPEGFRLIHGYYDDPASPQTGWWWASLRDYSDRQNPAAITFEHRSDWATLASHFSPTAKLMMNGRAHRTMIGPDIFSAEQRLRAAGLTVNLDPARAFPREDPVLQMHAYYLLHASQTATCDLCRKKIERPEGRLLPAWLFRHNAGIMHLAIAALSPTEDETDASTRRFWRDWSPWVSCDMCFETMLGYEAFKVAFEATCLRSDDNVKVGGSPRPAQETRHPGLQTVCFDRRSSPDPFLLRDRKFFERFFHQHHPFRVRARNQTHWPVRSEHQAFCSKRLQDDVEIGLNLLRRPGRPVCFSDYPRNLAVHVWPFGKLLYVLSPRRHVPCPDPRFRDVIQHKHLVRVPVYKLDRLGQMLFENQDVVCQAECPQLSNARIEIISQHVIRVRLILQYVPQAAQLRITRQPLDRISNMQVSQRSPAHHTANEVPFVRQSEQPFCFPGAARLNGNGSANARARNLFCQMFRQKIAPDPAHAFVNPAVLCRIVFPKMLVRIDSHKALARFQFRPCWRNPNGQDVSRKNVAAQKRDLHHLAMLGRLTLILIEHKITQ